MRWIDLESAAEAERLARRRRDQDSRHAESTGETLLDMVIEEHESGLGGRFLFTLVKRNRSAELPWNRLRVGSPVLLSSIDDPELPPVQAVVSARNRKQIQVAADDWPEGTLFRIDLSADEVTRKRQRIAISAARQATGRIGELRDTILGSRTPRFQSPERFANIVCDQRLNDSQRDAVRFAMSAEDIAVIHGPPGTGKTTTIVELIRQLVQRGEKVLATAPSNTAVDNLVDPLAKLRINVVRIGHPARVEATLRDLSLDMLAANHESRVWIRELMQEAETIYRQMGKYTRAKPKRGARREMRQEANELRREARRLERQTIKDILDAADVICATSTFDTEILNDFHFDTAIVDEACQSTEPGCWQPILFADRLILAGDFQQLPPTVLSAEAAREGFAYSMLESLVARFGDKVTRQLLVQYRMHHQIMDFSNREFYEGTLEADPSVATHLLRDLPLLAHDPIVDTACTFFDTAGASWDEEIEPDGESKRNPNEAEFLVRKARRFVELGVNPEQIAVIAPYAAQVRYIRELLGETDIEVDTVDGFQGREKEVVLISLVRSNAIGQIGFLSDKRRMNVAMTRARRKLLMVGDSATLATNDFYARLIDYFQAIGAYHSVWEEID